MSKLKLFLISIPILGLFSLWQFGRLWPEKKINTINKVSPQVVGRWIVGPHKTFNDADTLLLQVAIDNAINGDTILLRPGNYTIQNSPLVDVTIRGLSAEPSDVVINLKKELHLKQKSMRIENVLLNNSFKGKFGIILHSGKLYADNIKIKFTQIKNDIVLENNSNFTSLNNHFIGTKLNTSIYLSENSELFAENNKFIKFKNAIETNHGNFNGKLVIKNIEISHCLSSGIYIHGGELEGKNINISKSASGLIISGNAVVELDQLVIKNNKFFALDIINGANVQIDLFQFDQNKQAGIRASGPSSLVNALNGEITASKVALISESQATIFGKNINLKNGIGRPSKATDGGVIKLSN